MQVEILLFFLLNLLNPFNLFLNRNYLLSYSPSIQDVIKCYRKPIEAQGILQNFIQKRGTPFIPTDEICHKYINRIRQKLKQHS